MPRSAKRSLNKLSASGKVSSAERFAQVEAKLKTFARKERAAKLELAEIRKRCLEAEQRCDQFQELFQSLKRWGKSIEAQMEELDLGYRNHAAKHCDGHDPGPYVRNFGMDSIVMAETRTPVDKQSAVALG